MAYVKISRIVFGNDVLFNASINLRGEVINAVGGTEEEAGERLVNKVGELTGSADNSYRVIFGDSERGEEISQKMTEAGRRYRRPEVEEAGDFRQSVDDLTEDLMMPALGNGRVTPNADLVRWVAAYHYAEGWAAVMMEGEMDFGVIDIPGGMYLSNNQNRFQNATAVDSKRSRFIRTMNVLMNQRGCVGAFERTPNGETWLEIANRKGAGIVDVTNSSFKSGSGKFREWNHRNINGNTEVLDGNRGSSDVRVLDPETGNVIKVIEIERAPEDYYKKHQRSIRMEGFEDESTSSKKEIAEDEDVIAFKNFSDKDFADTDNIFSGELVYIK